jgi:signal transduction histidine kinase
MIDGVNRWLSGRTASWLALLLCLGLVAFAWNLTRRHIESEIENRFQVEIDHTITGLGYRLGNYAQVLISGSAFFASAEHVTRREWGQFISLQEVQKRYPGIQGLGFAAWVPSNAKDKHVSKIRAEDVAEYDIRPPGARAVYVPILYNEPYVGRNARVVGFDMYSEATRRQAMDRARRDGTPALSGRVVLAGEQPDERPPGFVIYVPVRKPGEDEISGFVFAPFRMADFMAGFLKEYPLRLSYRIFDGERIDADALMFDSGSLASRPKFERPITRLAAMTFAGRTWMVEFVATTDFDANIDRRTPWIVLGLGLIASFLVYGMMNSLYVSRRSEARFRDYANLASDWLWEQDADLRFTFNSGGTTNRPIDFVSKFLGRTRREFLERHGDPNEKDIWDRLDDLCQRQEPFKDITYSLFSDDRRRHFYRISGAPVFDGDGRFLGYRGVGKNVTEEMERIEETKQAKLAAESASASKTRFLAMMSHELRTPLNAIIGFSGLLTRKPPPDPAKADDYAQDIGTSSRHLLDMINHILDMSKIESGNLELSEEAVDLGRAVNASFALVRPKAEQGGIALVAPEGPIDVQLRADSRAIRQIFVNLLSNAVKFTPRGGTVELRVARQADGSATVVVRDTGIGIAPAVLKHIFEPFRQADSSIARRFGGTGLGLPISKALVEALGGTLAIESALGKGTEVRVTFPADRVTSR